MMVFVISILIISWLYIYLYKISDNFKFSKTTLIFLLLSITANISLAQNYTKSLIPGVHDGIGISNKIAYWIITDDHTWSAELFLNYYDRSTTLLIIAILLFVFSIVIESRLNSVSARESGGTGTLI